MQKCCGNLLDIARLNALLNKKQAEPVEEKKSSTLKWVLIIVGIVLVVGIIAFFAYNFLVSMLDSVVQKMETRTMEFMDLLNEPIK